MDSGQTPAGPPDGEKTVWPRQIRMKERGNVAEHNHLQTGLQGKKEDDERKKIASLYC